MHKLYNPNNVENKSDDDKIITKPKKIKPKEKNEQILSLENDNEESEHPFDQSFSSGSDFYEKMSYTDKSKIE